MRHLQLLPCPESWERMRVDGEGRHCERCSLRVIDTTTLDEEALASLGADPTQRSCGRFELEGGRPRGKHGLAAGVLVLALAGCAAPMEAQTAAPALSWSDLVDETGDEANPDAAGIIAGVVRDQSGTPLEGALVVLMSTALPQSFERMTSARGVYVFRDLPPGNYTIQVL
ncbi:MAG: carboxypeptidase regulatory-like domain-containing protein, partial [Myxococcales bacterium]|nr:carboxypeptidase regulatory-like domain-containing protein [Myxococcales bacterium]